MKSFCTFMILILILAPVYSKQIYLLPEVVKPFRINVDENHVFIGDGAIIYVYSKKDAKLLHKFGKAGEGPREFRLFPEFSPELDIQKNGILVNSLGKISLFSKTGDFKWEKKSPGYVLEHFNRLWNDKIVGQRVERDADTRYLVVKFYSKDFGQEREIYRHTYYLQRGKHNPIQRGLYISNFYIYDGQVFVGGAIDSGTIHVYDQNGKRVREIKPPFDNVPFTEKDKQGWIDSYMSNDEYKQLYERRKKWFDYPEYFPLFQNFIVTDNRIYLQTYKRNEKQSTNEVFIVDLTGKLIKRVWVPLVEFWDFSPNPYAIKSGNIFQVVENDNTEEWELHVIQIE